MNFRSIVLGAASIAAFLPVVCHASAESTALDACTRAFAASMAASGAGAPAFKLIRSSEPESAIDDYYIGHEYTFYFQARNQKTGMRVASAKCTTDARGTQVALTAAPVSGPGSLAMD